MHPNLVSVEIQAEAFHRVGVLQLEVAELEAHLAWRPPVHEGNALERRRRRRTKRDRTSLGGPPAAGEATEAREPDHVDPLDAAPGELEVPEPRTRRVDPERGRPGGEEPAAVEVQRLQRLARVQDQLQVRQAVEAQVLQRQHSERGPDHGAAGHRRRAEQAHEAARVRQPEPDPGHAVVVVIVVVMCYNPVYVSLNYCVM